MSKSEVTALRDLQTQLREGTAQHIPLPADKDRAFTLVSQSQHTAVWEKAMSGSQYTLVEPNSINWKAVVRAVRMAADRALKSSTISPDTYRYITQHCTGTVREPKGNLLVKTHKPMQPCTAVPAKTRLYIDTVNGVTTPAARYISVMLTPARERIPHRIKDTRHLMAELSQMTFKQSVRIIIIDVTDFYPNTATSDGELVMQKHLPPDQASLCVEFSNIIHESMVVATPVGNFKVPDSYGIGFGHSAETCDLVYSDTVEQPILSTLLSEGIIPDFYGRMIGDLIMIIDCTDTEVERIEHLFQTTDPNKPVTFKHSTQSADYLDVTVFKGPSVPTYWHTRQQAVHQTLLVVPTPPETVTPPRLHFQVHLEWNCTTLSDCIQLVCKPPTGDDCQERTIQSERVSQPITDCLSWSAATNIQEEESRIQQYKDEVSSTQEYSRKSRPSHSTQTAVHMQVQCTREAPQDFEASKVHRKSMPCPMQGLVGEIRNSQSEN